MSDRPVIDLSGGKYDDLETKLSQFLGLKVLLLRGWNKPHAVGYFYKPANSETGQPEEFNCYGASDPTIVDLTLREARWSMKQFKMQRGEKFAEPLGENPVTTARRESLREYLYDRDPQIGGNLSDIDLDAIAKTGHLTLRDSNAAPPTAVVVADKDFSDPDTLKKWLTGLYDFNDSQYNNSIEDRKKVSINSFVENLDVDPAQARAYEALRKIRFALQNQHEYDNQDRGWYYMPLFYQYAQLHSFERKQNIWDEGCQVKYHELRHMYEGDSAWAREKFGLDNAFMEKLLQARSLGDTHYFATNPMQTLARLTARNFRAGPSLSGEFNLNEFMQFQEKLERKIQKQYEAVTGDMFGDDLRIRIPIFREIYKAGTWNETEQAYLDTIWAGLERFMPTLAHAPVFKKGDRLQTSAAEARKMSGGPPSPAPGLS